MTATPLPNLENTMSAVHWLRMNKGTRPADNFPMVQVCVDGEWHEFRSHKSAANFLYDCRANTIFEAFKNRGGGITFKARFE